MEGTEGSWQQLPAAINITAAVLRRRHRGDHDHAQPGGRLPASAHHRHRAGLLFDRVAGAGWLSRQIAGPNRLLVTSALVGIAGSFVGYHLALLIGIAGYGALLVAVIGALAVLWGWRTVR